jgi:hypothetical protein
MVVSHRWLCRVSQYGTRQRKNTLRVPPRWHWLKVILPSVISSHSQSIFIYFFLPPNFLCFAPTIPRTTCWNLAHFSKCLLYLVNLFHLIVFLRIIQIWTASHSNNGKKWMEKMIFMLSSLSWGRIQEQTINFEHLVPEACPRTCGRVAFKLYKRQTKSKNHKTYRDVMISYVEAMIKKLRSYHESFHVRYLESEESPHEIMKLLHRFFGV